MWVMVWYFMFCFDQVYIKHAVDSVAMDSNWGRVFYCNLLAALPLIPSAYSEFTSEDMEWTVGSVTALGASCMLGCGISYFAFMCRKVLSATAFTVVGNCCKIATVIINYFIWDLHASPTGEIHT
jgi:GDP-mannose transporter